MANLSDWNQEFPNISKLFLAPVIALVCLGSIINLQKKQIEVTSKSNVKEYYQQEKAKKIKINLLNNAPDFGFSNLIANYSFLGFVQYFGDYHGRNQTGYSLNSEYFETVIKHDPRFVDAYLKLAPATSMFEGKPETTVSLMAKGVESISPENPMSYMIWMYKGVDELLFLGDNQAAKKSYEKAAEWAKVHDDETSKIIGARARETAEFLATNPNSKKAQASSWMMIYSNSKEESVKDFARQRIEALGGEIIITPYQITVKMPEEDDNNG